MTIRTVTRGTCRRLVLDIPYTTPAGIRRRYRHDAQVQTMTAARAEHDRLLRQLALTGELPDAKRLAADAERRSRTWKDAVEYYRANFAPKLKPSTRVGYDAMLDGPRFRRWNTWLLTDIDEKACAELDAVLAKAKTSLSFRRNHQVLVRSVLNAAVVAGFLPTRPNLPKLLKVGHKVIKVPTTDEVDRVIAASRPHQRVALALAVYAGLRAGEIRGLRRRDVDLRVGLLTVRENRCHGKISAPKSGHERIVPIADALRPHLVAAFGRGRSDARAHVCRTRLGEPLSQNSIYDALKRAQARAGVSGWKVHALRHHFVTTLFRRGVGANVVQRLAGHHSLTVTQRYAHTTEDDLREAVARLGGGNGVVTAATGTV